MAEATATMSRAAPDRAPYPLPAQALDDRLGWVGTTGAGKTYNAGTAIERLLASGARAVICDPLGVWWGLRLAADGKRPAFPVVIFGGPHGDLPLTEHAGRLIGEAAATMAESCIVDLCDIGTAAGERRFMLGFLTALYFKTAGAVVHLVLDEADMWAPQTIRDRDGDANKLFAITERIVRRGRIKGFIPWLLTQRPAEISKSVLGMVDGLVAMTLPAPQDRDALDAWIGGQAESRAQAKEIKDQMPGLVLGEAIVWLAKRRILARVRFPAKTTFDSSRTPKRGEAAPEVELKPLDMGALKQKLASVEAEATANDPARLKAEIRRLTAELARKPAGATDPGQIAAVFHKGRSAGLEIGYRAGFSSGWGAGLANAKSALDPLFTVKAREPTDKGLAASLSLLEMTLRDDADHPTRPAGAAPPQPPSRPARALAVLASVQPTPAAREAPDDEAQRLGEPLISGAQRHLLAALAWWRAMGHESVGRAQLAAIAGWKVRSSHLRNRLTELLGKGLVDYPRPSEVGLTAAGVEAAPTPDLHRTLIGSARQILSGAQRTLFDALLDAGDRPVTRAELAAATGWALESSHLRNRLTELKNLELIDYPSRGEVELQSWVRLAKGG